ncbi:hypothetical protein, partial [Azospirillum sp.]|uniref:hypothetical protein n=1 Tax=Azospirillum sp. TaxID=34012 RepID=UPI002636E097
MASPHPYNCENGPKPKRQKFFTQTQKRSCVDWGEATITRSTDGAALHEAARRRRKRKRKQAVG